MQTPGDELNERLRQAREQARQRMGPGKKNEPKEAFVPYKTMFKLEERPRPQMNQDLSARGVQCVNCGHTILFTIYTIAPERFDERCSKCGVTADAFWKGKLHRELDVDA